MRAPAMHAVTPGGLGAIEGLVGAPQQIGNLDLGTPVESAYPDADGDDTLFAAGMRKPEVAHLASKGLGDDEGASGVGLGQDDRELLAAIAGRRVGRPPRRCLDAAADGAQAFVARRVAVLVVEALEPVDIDDEQAERR